MLKFPPIRNRRVREAVLLERNDYCRKGESRRVGKAKRAHHPSEATEWWARRKRAFAHPTISMPRLPDGQIKRIIRQIKVQPLREKYSDFPKIQINSITHAVSSHLRGGSRSSRTRGGMRWTRMVLTTKAPEADGEVVWS